MDGVRILMERRDDRTSRSPLVVQVLPGQLAICVKATDVSGGADVVALSLVKIPE
jgi:hypothetical protein